MKALGLIALSLSLTSCGACSRLKANYAGYDRVCVAGVNYLQMVSGVTVEYTRDGKVKTCNE